jgi:hypothetical protein
MEITDAEVCLKAFIDLCEELSRPELISSEDCQYWIFECGYLAALEALENVQNVDTAFLELAWSTQPSLERDFALH